MQPRVIAILVARNGADYLDRTLAALRAQTHRPDILISVDAGSTDASPALLAAAGPTYAVTVPARAAFGSSVARGVEVVPPAESDEEWLWLLAHDSAPHPRALASLLAAVEIAPSVAIAGPKLMRWSQPDTIARYGESVTRLGASVILVEDELDQAQHDTQSDLLGVSASGMLVRRSVWTTLGGFDPGLPSVDAALDFSIRARLAGHRVIGVPGARVESAGGPELFGRRSISASASARLRRRAQLHRRMVYARGGVLPLLWLSLLPFAILRSLLHILRKQPGSIAGELSSALRTAFSGSIVPARRNFRRTRKLGWRVIAPLRVSSAGARERRAGRLVASDSDSGIPVRTRASFVSGGGLAVVVIAAVIGVIAFGPLLGASAVQGGGLLPLSQTVAELWANVGYGWHSVGGFTGASDPFAAVLAVLGSITFWSPSSSIVILYFLALPLAALGAWWCGTVLSARAWPPAVAALLWSLAPPFLSSMDGGHLGAVIAHILLPWLVFATLSAARSWSASAVAALLFAATAASAPSLVPALVVMLVIWIAARPTRVLRLIGIVIPAAVLFAPLVIAQVVRGTPLAAFADPGVPSPSGRPSPGQLALGVSDTSANGWLHGDLAQILSLPGALVLAILLVPLLALAVAAAFLPGLGRSIPSLLVAVLGFATAVAATQLALTASGMHSVTVWPGSGLSLMWFGLTGAAIVALDAIGRAAAIPSLVVVLASALAVGPLLLAPLTGTAQVVAGTGTLLPAYVAAEAASRPRLGTLVLSPQADGGLSATVERGTGASLDDQSTLAATATALSASQRATAMLAANLASRSGLDVAPALTAQKIGFVLLTKATGAGALEVRQRANDALDARQTLTSVGSTAFGQLWRFGALPREGLRDAAPSGGALRPWILAGMALVFFVTLVLAIPTAGRRRSASVATVTGEHATLGEDDDA